MRFISFFFLQKINECDLINIASLEMVDILLLIQEALQRMKLHMKNKRENNIC